ncbi:SLBB domain-containing protein [Kangiella sp. TOML190]|uniref:SLBB domain-containing protein n=1 Tax=Kangiella sp. TOML190 TaxID=2931351 RepID=UPI00203D2760|nr:SLBB domain-containing protein [Kangiella sp. TOML190]
MNKIRLVTISLLLSLFSSFTLEAASPDLSQAKKLCTNATEAQKQAAKAAGYDVDSLCASLREQTDTDKTLLDVQTPAILPRDIKALEELGLEKNKHQETTEKIAKVDEPLEKFGYDLFAGEPTTYTPVGNIPVPSNYIAGPGDMVRVQLYGKENSSYELQVGRDGAIQFPNLGPIYVSGLSYDELKAKLNEQIQEQIIGVQANISMGELRSIQVFISGEAYRPGAYTVSSLSTILNALYVSGGVKEIGSLRNIQLKRNGRLVSTLDLYDLLLRGDTRGDRRLQAGDVIFIPSVKKTASIAGEVVRPAIYELKGEKTLAELLSLAGGLLPNAAPEASRVQRVDANGSMTVVDVNLKTSTGKKARLQNGDLLQVFPVLERQENVVNLEGHIYREGAYAWRSGLRVSDIIKTTDMLKPNANLDFALLIRETKPLKSLQPLKIDLRAISENKASATNLQLEARDRIIVLSNAIEKKAIQEHKEQIERKEIEKLQESNKASAFNLTSTTNQSSRKKSGNESEKNEALINEELGLELRNALVIELVSNLKSQASFKSPAKVISVTGAVKFPGEYPLTDNMTAVDLIFAAGGLQESAFAVEAEVTRYDLNDPLEAKVTHATVDLQQEFLGNVSFQLKPHDQLKIKVTPEYRDFSNVEVSGEVKFPGEYRIQRGETLSQLIKRVGGINAFGSARAAVFSRRELREHEEKELRKLKERLRQDVAAAELENKNIGKSADVDSAKSLLDVLDTTEATGRLVVDLQGIIEGSVSDVMLKDGDKLYIPAHRQEITVVGEVQVPTSHLYNDNLDYDDYILRSGGEKETANSDAIYIVKADGSVVLPNRSGWLTHGEHEVQAGDTIVVPLDTSRVDGLELWTKVSQIVYQLALGAAAVNSF